MTAVREVHEVRDFLFLSYRISFISLSRNKNISRIEIADFADRGPP